MIDGRISTRGHRAFRYSDGRQVFLHGDRKPDAAAALVGVGLIAMVVFALGWLVGYDCAGQAWAREGNPSAECRFERGEGS
jgi:hypothetical protein